MNADAVYCVECGQAVVPTATFCKACGARQEPDLPGADAVPERAEAREEPSSPRATATVPPQFPPPSGPAAAATAPDWAASRAVTALQFTRDEWIVAGTALALFIDLLALPWFEISTGIASLSFTLTATQSPDGWLGVLALLSAVVLIVDLLVDRLSPQTPLPAIGDSRAMTRLVIAGVCGAFVALKFLFHVHFSWFGAGFYIAVLLVGAMVTFAELARRNEHKHLNRRVV